MAVIVVVLTSIAIKVIIVVVVLVSMPLLVYSLSPFNPHTGVRCMRLWLECFPYLQGCLQVSGKYLVAGITLNQLKGRQMVIYMVWMVEYRS